MKQDKWLRRWHVNGSNGHTWVVAIDAAGMYGCSCPRWKFHREQCHHIEAVKGGGGLPEGGEVPRRPQYVLAHVCAPIVKGTKLLIPLVAIGDTHMEATICYAMIHNGYSWAEIREERRVPRQWTAKAVTAYIHQHGLASRPCCASYPHQEDAPPPGTHQDTHQDTQKEGTTHDTEHDSERGFGLRRN